MDKMVRDHMAKEMGEKFPDYSKRFEKKWYNSIDKLSPDVMGVTKEDARHHNRLMHATRNKYRITVEEMKYFQSGLSFRTSKIIISFKDTMDLDCLFHFLFAIICSVILSSLTSWMDIFELTKCIKAL